jgi:hypothetical protein
LGDLIYLDPPFNSNFSVAPLYGRRLLNGEKTANIVRRYSKEAVYREIVERGFRNLADLVQVLLAFLGRDDMMGHPSGMPPRRPGAPAAGLGMTSLVIMHN